MCTSPLSTIQIQMKSAIFLVLAIIFKIILMKFHMANTAAFEMVGSQLLPRTLFCDSQLSLKLVLIGFSLDMQGLLASFIDLGSLAFVFQHDHLSALG